MIKITPSNLPESTQRHLEEQQAKITAKGSYAEKVSEGKKLWANKSSAHFAKGKHIRSALEKCCTGRMRCQYCEDSVADEIEHIYPKDLYPEFAFSWNNYVYSCGICNSTYKGSQFSVFDANNNAVDITRPPKRRVEQPVAGRPLFIDIRNEDPFDFFNLDFTTGIFTSKSDIDSQEYKRAMYTIKILQLNRDILTSGRKCAYRVFLHEIKAYTQGPESGVESNNFKTLKETIILSSHMTVWNMMKTNANDVQELKAIFDDYPELLNIS